MADDEDALDFLDDLLGDNTDSDDADEADFLASLLADTEGQSVQGLAEPQNRDLTASQGLGVPKVHFIAPRTYEDPWCVLHVYTSQVGGKHRVVHMLMRGISEDDAVEYAAAQPQSTARGSILTVISEQDLRASGVPLPRLRNFAAIGGR